MANAIKQLNNFDSPNLSFAAFENADFSDVNLSFDGFKVESSLMDSLNTLNDFSEKIIDLKNKVIKLRDSGVSSTNINEAFNSFNNKIMKCNRSINDSKEYFIKFINARLEMMSVAEMAAYRIASDVKASDAMNILNLSHSNSSSNFVDMLDKNIQLLIAQGDKELEIEQEQTGAKTEKGIVKTFLDNAAAGAVGVYTLVSTPGKFGMTVLNPNTYIDLIATGDFTNNSLGNLYKKSSEIINSDDVTKAAFDYVVESGKKTFADIGVVGTSYTEGVLGVAENFVDAAAIIEGVYTTPIMLVLDAVNKSSDNNLSTTKKSWEKIMDFVGTNHVKEFYDNYYETMPGSVLKENATNFDDTREVVSTVGKIAGTVAISLATAGVGNSIGTAGSLSNLVASNSLNIGVTAAIPGLGKGAQEARSKGASVGESLTAGALTGVKDGVLMSLGTAAQGITVGNGLSGASKILTSGLHMGSAATLSGTDPIAAAAIESTYSKGYTDGYTGEFVEYNDDTSFKDKLYQILDDKGGMETIINSGLAGAFLSGAGEIQNSYVNQNNIVNKFLNKSTNKLINYSIVNSDKLYSLNHNRK